MIETPCDVAAERAVLSCMLKGGFTTYSDIADILVPDAFVVPANQSWYKCLETIYEKDPQAKPDLPTLLSTANSLGFSTLTESKQEHEYLRALAKFPADPANARKLAQTVRKLHIARLFQVELQIADGYLRSVTGQESVSKIISGVEERVFNFSSKVATDDGVPEKIGDLAGDYYEAIANQEGSPVISSGFPWWDKSLGGGLFTNTVEVIGARTKAGKSFHKNAIAMNVALTQGIPVLDVDTELTKEEQLERFGSAISGVPLEDIKLRKFRKSPEHVAALKQAGAKFKIAPYYHRYVAGWSQEDILAMIRRWMVRVVGLDEHGYVKPCLVLYDYLKLTTSAGLENLAEYQTMGFAVTSLKDLMGRYRGRCVAYVQLNRQGVETEDETAIAQSDRILWIGTSFSILRWQADEELAAQPKPIYKHKMVPILSRNGPRWDRRNFIHIKSDLSVARMEEGPTRDELGSSSFAVEKSKKPTEF